MNYIDVDAAETFYLLALHSHEIGLTGWSGLEERLACLADMLDPDDMAYEALRRAVPDALIVARHVEEEAEPEVWLERDQSQNESGARRAGGRALPAPPAMHLIVRSVAGMKQWTFHEFDRDSFPSVPHGHQYGRKHPKCDPYTGRVYDSHREELQRERLGRKTRIALWQDREFREFALRAIVWYENEFPYYRFRVPHPRRLPRLKR